MAHPRPSKPEYAAWVSSKLVHGPAGLAVILGGLSALSPWFIPPAVLCFSCAAYFAYARRKLSSGKGGIQPRIQAMVLHHMHWRGTGEVLDIGCGSGPLTIAIAKAYPSAHITGVDTWGGWWNYSKALCEQNARLEGVADQVTFQNAGAADLPFHEDTFDAVISNLVFHEVRGVADKRLLLKEALRVLKKGGIFVFQDLFLLEGVYGDMGDLLSAIRGWGVAGVYFSPTSKASFIPKALKLPFMIGTIGIVYGSK